jgi:hypothetical protein
MMPGGLGNPPVSIRTWDGQTLASPSSPSTGLLNHAYLRDPGALMRLALDPECQFGELYSIHRLDVEGN